MNAFALCLIFIPLAAYFLLLGTIHLRRRPLLISGGRDMAAVAVALAGLVALGPMELFMPESAAARFGSLVWLQLGALYGLIVSLTVLLMRPRLVIYNISPEQLRPALCAALQQLGVEPRWAGDCLAVPHLGIQLHLESSGLLRHVQLIAAGPRQDYDGWRRFARALRIQLATVRVPRNRGGGILVGLALLALLLVAISIVRDPQGVTTALLEKLRW